MYHTYHSGESLPMTELIYWMDAGFFDLLGSGSPFTTQHILIAIFLYPCGATLGYIALAFWPAKKRFHGTMIAMGCIGLVLGLLTVQLPMFYSPYVSYIAAYTAILGALQGNVTLCYTALTCTEFPLRMPFRMQFCADSH